MAVPKENITTAHPLTAEITTKDEDDKSLDSLLEQLDEEESEFLSQYRDQRLEELSEHMKKIEKNVESGDYGSVQTFLDEQRLIQVTASAERCVVHFFVDSFRKCQVMDSKLQVMAESHLSTRFFRISVADCPFLVEKLSLKVLPVVIAYQNGKEQDRLIGFAKLGNNANDFSIDQLEKWLQRSGVVPMRDTKLTIISNRSKQIRSKNKTNSDQEDSGSDWD